MTITNREAATYVAEKREFRTTHGSIYGTHDIAANTYTVYSYGGHFPMYVFDYTLNEWWGNSDKYSRTTSKHQSITRPSQVKNWVNTSTLQNISIHGVIGSVAHKLAA